MTAKDWTLLVVAAAPAGQLQPVHLQKTLFLIGRKFSPDELETTNFYQFEPYDYGPFCGAVYADAEELREEGHLHIDQPPTLSYRLYSATEAGKARALELRRALRPSVRDSVDRLVKWTSSLSFKQLVSAIYRDFPDMKVNSVFQE